MDSATIEAIITQRVIVALANFEAARNLDMDRVEEQEVTTLTVISEVLHGPYPIKISWTVNQIPSTEMKEWLIWPGG